MALLTSLSQLRRSWYERFHTKPITKQTPAPVTQTTREATPGHSQSYDRPCGVLLLGLGPWTGSDSDNPDDWLLL